MNATAYPGYGPTAYFVANWKGDRGSTETQSFALTVPVVPPIGERSVWSGSLTGVFVTRWQQTLVASGNDLIPPQPEDPNFDFDGDCVSEALGPVLNQCNAARPIPSTFLIGPGSHYNDYIGIGTTIPLHSLPCKDVAHQTMFFKSQAESFWERAPYTDPPNQIDYQVEPSAFPNFDFVRLARSTFYSPNPYAPALTVPIDTQVPFFVGNAACNR